MRSVHVMFLVALVGCGRLGIEPSVDSAKQPPGDGLTDGTATGDGTTAVIAGTYALDSAINYTCASGLVAIGVNRFTFDTSTSMLSVTSDDSGAPQQPCAMTGVLPTGTTFDATCTLSGTCNETYRLTGSMTGAKTWSGTFTASFSGMCLSCTTQTLPRTGTAP